MRITLADDVEFQFVHSATRRERIYIKEQRQRPEIELGLSAMWISRGLLCLHIYECACAEQAERAENICAQRKRDFRAELNIDIESETTTTSRMCEATTYSAFDLHFVFEIECCSTVCVEVFVSFGK